MNDMNENEANEEYSIGGLIENYGPDSCPARCRMPSYIRFPDNTGMTVSDWEDVTIFALAGLFSEYGTPRIPFPSISSPKKYYLNTKPIHEDECPFQRWQQVPIQDSYIYVDTNKNAWAYVKNIYRVMKAVNADPYKIVVQLKPESKI